MGSKAIVLLGLFLATVFLISSEVAAARELAETSNDVNTVKETNGAAAADGVNPDDRGRYEGGHGGGGGGYGGGRGGYGGGGRGGGGGHGGGYCRHGCCGRSNRGGGCRCCTYAGEKADAEP